MKPTPTNDERLEDSELEIEQQLEPGQVVLVAPGTEVQIVQAFAPLTRDEVKALTAMVWGAPAGDVWIAEAGIPFIRAYEECLRRGERPKDPSKGGRLSTDAWMAWNRGEAFLPDAPAAQAGGWGEGGQSCVDALHAQRADRDLVKGSTSDAGVAGVVSASGALSGQPVRWPVSDAEVDAIADDDCCRCPNCLAGVDAPHEYHLEPRPMPIRRAA